MEPYRGPIDLDAFTFPIYCTKELAEELLRLLEAAPDGEIVEFKGSYVLEPDPEPDHVVG